VLGSEYNPDAEASGGYGQQESSQFIPHKKKANCNEDDCDGKNTKCCAQANECGCKECGVERREEKQESWTRDHFSAMQALRSTTLSSQAYVLSLASLNTFYAASASSPSNLIDLFDKSTFQGVQTFPGHDSATTYLRTVQSIAGSTRQSLVSCGKDGTVRAWDERSNVASIKCECLGLPVLEDSSQIH